VTSKTQRKDLAAGLHHAHAMIDGTDGFDLPRERLERLGAECLTSAELIALILGAGRPGQSAVEVANQLLERAGGLVPLSRAGSRELSCQDGIGSARAARLAAAFQLGRRVLAKPGHRPLLDGPDKVFELLGPSWRGLAQEVFVVIGLTARNTMISMTEVARGSALSVDVHPREVFRPLIRHGACAAVVAHNHPSGDPSPSPSDLALTDRLRQVGELVGVPLVDHVVIGDDRFSSIAETGWIPDPDESSAPVRATSAFLPLSTGRS